MTLNEYLKNNGYNENLRGVLTRDLIDNMVDKIGNSIINKENIEKYSKDSNEYNRQLDEMVSMKDSLEQLDKSYSDLFQRATNILYVNQLDDLNKEISTSILRLDTVDKQLDQYLKLKEICEFLDQNQNITTSNIDYCVDFMKMKEEILVKNQSSEECIQLLKRSKTFEKNVKQFVSRYFVNIIEINRQIPVGLTIIRKDYDEFIKLLTYLNTNCERENVMALMSHFLLIGRIRLNLGESLLEFVNCILNASKNMPKIVDNSGESVSLLFEEHKIPISADLNKLNDCSNPKEFSDSGLSIIGVFVDFLYRNLPYFGYKIINMRESFELLSDFRKQLIVGLLKEMLNKYSKIYRKQDSARVKKYFIEMINRVENFESCDTAVDFTYNPIETDDEFSSEIDFLRKLEPEKSAEVDLLDRIRLLFVGDNFSFITSVNKSDMFKELHSNDSINDVIGCDKEDLEVNHPEFWRKLLERPCILGDYSFDIKIHEFVHKFILLMADFYFNKQKNENHSIKFKTLRNGYKIFTIMVKHKLNECKGQITSFAFFYNDLQILNYFTTSLNLTFTSHISSSPSCLLTLGDYMIDFDDTFNRAITSVLKHYNSSLVKSTNQLELSFINNNVQKRNSHALHQIKDSLRDFSFKHKNIIPTLVLKKYVGILSNNVAAVVALKITELTDIPEKNIPHIVALIEDIMDFFATYGLDTGSSDELSKVPVVGQLKHMMKILTSNLYMIAQMWSDSSNAAVDDKNENSNLRTYLTREQIIKLIESIFQESNIRADVIDKIRWE